MDERNSFRLPRSLWALLYVFSLWVLSFLAGACSAPDADVEAESTPENVVDHLALAQAAVAHPDRPEADVADDERRRPAEVAAFFGLEPGMQVLDMLCGTGYYAEIAARIVGETGRVRCQNNQSYLNFMAESYETRYEGDRLPNLQRLDVEVADLDLDSDSLDAVLFVLGYHDLYFRPENGSWPEMDAAALLAELYDGLKPGGVLAIVDHAAQPGGDVTSVATTLHRIDEARVKEEIQAAGFVLEAESDLLRNPEDSREISVFDAAIRRQTDRFVLRFRKPLAD